MERLLKFAQNLFTLKTESGTYREELPPVSVSKYFDYVLSQYDAKSILQLQKKVAEKINDLGFPDTASKKLISYAAVHILMEPYRRSLVDSFDMSSWQKSSCPFCGNRAGLSHLQDNGRRKLICYFCWTEWDYPRAKCFNCQKEVNEYALFELSKSEARVDYCKSCNSYIKTVIYEYSEEPYVIWDLKSVSLDEWAISKGYKKPTPSLIGIDFTK